MRSTRIHLAAMDLMLWIVLGLVNSGFVYAHFYGEYPDLHSPRENRKEAAFAIGWSVLGGPLAVTVTLINTGFWYDGWKFPGSD